MCCRRDYFNKFVGPEAARLSGKLTGQTALRLETNATNFRDATLGGGLLLLLLVSGVIACRDWRRDPRHGILLLGAGIPTCVWLLWLPHDFYAVAALPCLATLGAIGVRTYPRWARQALWAAVAVTYGWSHWQVLPPL